MDDALVVAVSDGLDNLLGDEGSFTFVKCGAFSNLVEKLLAIALLHDHVDLLAILVDLIQPDNVRMVQVLEYLDFIAQAEQVLCFHASLADNLHSPLLIRVLLFAEMNLAESTLSYHIFIQIVVTCELLDVLVHHHEVSGSGHNISDAPDLGMLDRFEGLIWLVTALGLHASHD